MKKLEILVRYNENVPAINQHIVWKAHLATYRSFTMYIFYVFYLFSAVRQAESVDARAEFLNANPDVYANCIRLLFPILFEVYSSSVGN